MDAPAGNYSPNNPSVKRILREMKEMEKDTSDEYHARATEVHPSTTRGGGKKSSL